MRRVLIVDMDMCTGCMSCALVCSLMREGKFDPKRARIRIYKDESHCLAIPIVCEQCEDAPCMEFCSAGAIARDLENNIVKIDPDICTGCRLCVDACPYVAVVMDPQRNIAHICDLCGGDPECAKVCTPAGVIKYVEGNETMLQKKKEYAENRVKAYKWLTGCD